MRDFLINNEWRLSTWKLFVNEFSRMNRRRRRRRQCQHTLTKRELTTETNKGNAFMSLCVYLVEFEF
jgi:hypothetical protein